jgi:hypothetical protein
MTRDATLSQLVQGYLDTLDWEDDADTSPQERDELNEARRVVKIITDDVVASRETLTDGKLAAIEKLVVQMPDAIASFLDSRYTRDLIAAVPGYVRRTMELSRLESSRLPSKITNGYLREAVRTYIFGLPQASVALCRAALEQALKESLKLQGVPTFLRFNSLLEKAEKQKIIDCQIRQMAREIADAANDVLHEKPTDIKQASEVLLKLRGVLQHLYSD